MNRNAPFGHNSKSRLWTRRGEPSCSRGEGGLWPMWGHPALPGGLSNHPEINRKGRLSSISQLSGQVWRTFCPSRSFSVTSGYSLLALVSVDNQGQASLLIKYSYPQDPRLKRVHKRCKQSSISSVRFLYKMEKVKRSCLSYKTLVGEIQNWGLSNENLE